MNKLCSTSLALAGGLFLAGCAGMGPTPENQVLERAQERLDLFLAEDYAAAYDYLSPGYRSSVSSADYQRQQLMRRVRWTAARANESNCEEDSCKVRISLEYEVFGAVPGVTRFPSRGDATENWVRSDGQWYFVPGE